MIHHLSNFGERMRAYRQLRRYVRQGAMIEIKKVREQRTIQQNKYVHVLFQMFGSELGYTLEEAKIVVKRQFNDMFVYRKNGNPFMLSTADLSKDQMTEFIERFRNWSAQNGYYLPSADEYTQNWTHYNNEIEKAKGYL